MTDKIKINFQATENDREQLKVLAAHARLSQSEFIRRLIADYGEQLVRSLREPTFTPESGLPESDLNDPYLKFCRELGKLIVSMPEYTGTGISYIAAEQWYMSIGGMNFGKLYRSFNGNLSHAWDYIRD